MTNYDPVEERIGAFGPWHGRIISLLGLAGLFLNFQKLGTSYLLHQTEFWCSPKVSMSTFHYQARTSKNKQDQTRLHETRLDLPGYALISV